MLFISHNFLRAISKIENRGIGMGNGEWEWGHIVHAHTHPEESSSSEISQRLLLMAQYEISQRLHEVMVQ